MPKYIKTEQTETVIYNGSNKDEIITIIKNAMTYDQMKTYKKEEWDFSDWEQVQAWMANVLNDGYIHEGDEIGIFSNKLLVISPEGQSEGILEGKGWIIQADDNK